LKLKLTLLAGASLLAGCATVSHTPLAKEAAETLKGKTFSLTKYPTADFMSFTAGKAVFGLMGAAMMMTEGKQIVQDNAIPDPAIKISEGLGQKLASARSMKASVAGKIAEDDKVETLAASHPGVDYLVDVKTFNWMINYYPSNWNGYRVTYSARIRLIDTATKRVVAETACQTVQGDDAKPPTKDELLAANAALLKSYLDKGATACVDVVAKELFQI
jgi:hypothetical protein